VELQPSSPAKAGDPVIARPSLLDAPLSRSMTVEIDASYVGNAHARY